MTAVTDLRAQYPSDAFDPDKAASMFSAAGVNPASTTPEVRRQLRTANEDMKVAQVVSDQLRAAGFQVDVQPLTGGVLTDTIRRGDYDMAMNAFCPGYIAENLELFHSKNFVPLGQPAPWFERNSFRYSNTELDGIVDQMLQTAPSTSTR